MLSLLLGTGFERSEDWAVLPAMVPDVLRAHLEDGVPPAICLRLAYAFKTPAVLSSCR
jgi:hypothetical protein